jgi:hypothetical protein
MFPRPEMNPTAMGLCTAVPRAVQQGMNPSGPEYFWLVTSRLCSARLDGGEVILQFKRQPIFKLVRTCLE